MSNTALGGGSGIYQQVSTSGNGGGITFGALSTPAIVIPSGLYGQGSSEGVPTGMQSMIYTGGQNQQGQNAANLALNAELAQMYATNNANYQSGVNQNQSQYLNTANSLGQYQANAIGSQGKGK